MQQIHLNVVQREIDRFTNKKVYLHLETTDGAYASHYNKNSYTSGAYIRNAHVKYTQGKITGTGPYRVGLRLEIGWVYAEGVTHFEIDHLNRLLLAGHNDEGKLAVALQISEQPFPN